MVEKEKQKKNDKRRIPKFLSDGMLKPMDNNSGAT